MNGWEKRSSEEIAKLFKDILVPKCSKCNHKLSIYPYYDGMGEVRICENCGEVNRKNTNVEKRKKEIRNEIYNCR